MPSITRSSTLAHPGGGPFSLHYEIGIIRIAEPMTKRAEVCQLHCWGMRHPQPGMRFSLRQRFNRLKRILKRRRTYLRNYFREIVYGQKTAVTTPLGPHVPMQKGDIVTIRSREEIQETLNRWNQLHGCAFTEEMWPYCGSVHEIYKRVEHFLDERDHIMKRSKRLVVLKNLYCEGTIDFGPCHRACFFFWREEWLKKI